MFSHDTKVSPLSKTYFEAFCALLQEKLVYAAGERDMVIMHHVFGVERKDGSQERQTSTMVAYGDPSGYSAMAKTVGLPAAIAAEMILNGTFDKSKSNI